MVRALLDILPRLLRDAELSEPGASPAGRLLGTHWDRRGRPSG